MSRKPAPSLLTVFPEQSVVNVAASIELECSLKSNGSRDIPAAHSGIDLFNGSIQVGDIGVVVLAVVDLHDFGRNSRFQGIVVVRQIGKGSRAATGHGAQQDCRILGDCGRDFGRLQVDRGAEGGIENDFAGHDTLFQLRMK